MKLRSAARMTRWSGESLVPLGILFALNAVDELDRAVFSVLAPEIRDAFGLSNVGLGIAAGASTLVIVSGSLPLAWLGDRWQRTRVAAWSAVAWSVFVAATGVVGSFGTLFAVRIMAGLGQSSVQPVHSSLLVDYYATEKRARVFGIHRLANPVGLLVGPVLAGVVSVWWGWRWAFLLAAVPSLAFGLAALGLQEPKRGGRDQDLLDGTPVEFERASLRDGVRRLLGTPTLVAMWVAGGLLGFALIGIAPFVSVYWEEIWGIKAAGRGALTALLATSGLLGLPMGGWLGDRLMASGVQRGVYLSGAGILAFVVVYPVAVLMPRLWLVVGLQWLALLVIQLGLAPLSAAVAAVAPPQLRTIAYALGGIFVFAFGGFLAPIFVGIVADIWGIRAALVSTAPVGFIGAIMFFRAAPRVSQDIERIRAEVAARTRRAHGNGTRTLLEVDRIDVSYGPVQVLFGVSLSLREGETAALLGTNGAGKSTLLKAVSGLLHPSSGSIRFDGDDVTYLNAEHTVGHGIVQVPGGRGLFPSLTVLEHLKVGGHTIRGKDELRSAVDEAFGFFPELGAMPDRKAGLLSGGEQQMLALARAFMSRPRLLLIDELSLGLAPKLVDRLIGAIRGFQRAGITILLVDQSVNIALALATTAHFMEKGELRFSGPAEELRHRRDLLRSVFLAGVGSLRD